MHPGFAWWHARREAALAEKCSEAGIGDEANPRGGHGGPWGHRGWGRHHGHHGHGHHHGHHGEAHFASPDDGDFGAGAFGVRRPLRFLAYKLDLSEAQVADLARILDDLKTERAQGAVDQRRTTAAFADAVGSETFDATKVSEAAEARVKSAERLKEAVVSALGKIHALLDPEQRAKLAYLLRTGALVM